MVTKIVQLMKIQAHILSQYQFFNYKQMGNNIKQIGSAIGKKILQIDNVQNKTQNGIPRDIQKNMHQAEQLNNLLNKNIINLGMKVKIQANTLVRNGLNWGRSIMRGTVRIVDPKNIENLSAQLQKSSMIRQNNQNNIQKNIQINQSNINEVLQNYSKIHKSNGNSEKIQNQNSHINQSKIKESNQQNYRTYNIILTLQDIYQLKVLLFNYNQEQVEQQQKRKSSQGKLCVICLDKKPEEVLPCAHSYCHECVQKYVINRQKKCPMCRKSYRESLSKNIYQIVQWDQNFIIQMRNLFYKILERHNKKQVDSIRRRVKRNQKHKHEQQS